jgi:hypothetical protein
VRARDANKARMVSQAMIRGRRIVRSNAKVTGDLRQEHAQRADAARRPC